MTQQLDRADIQGNVLIPYGRNTFPMGHVLLFHCKRGSAAPHDFLKRLLPWITTAELFDSKRSRGITPKPPAAPPLTVNVAFTYRGLAALEVPITTLRGFPDEFQQGMKARAPILHDDIKEWDHVWRQEEHSIDLMIVMRVNMAIFLEKLYRTKGDRKGVNKADYHAEEVFKPAQIRAHQRLQRLSRGLIRRAHQHGVQVLNQDGSIHDPSDQTQTPWLPVEGIPRSAAEDEVFSMAHPEQHWRYSEYEHFGFFDGIADPVFEGQYPDRQQSEEEKIGQGRFIRGDWDPLATGEFLLGYPDEAQEEPQAPAPRSFSRNGTFLVVRKLHQDVASFEQGLDAQLPAFQAWVESGHDGQAPAAASGGVKPPREAGQAARKEARELLRAKLVGRWSDGTPLVNYPTYADWQGFREELRQLRQAVAEGKGSNEELTELKRHFRDFSYEAKDRDGYLCPITSHIRRSNPRDSGDPRLPLDPCKRDPKMATSVLANRRRMLRRGMSYGPPLRSADNDPLSPPSDDGQERGTLFMALCSSLFRQFEFVQQQWINYGSDFGAGNDVCPISGVMAKQEASDSLTSKLVIASPAEKSLQLPFIVRTAPPVQCRGGAYFFMPSLTALRMISHQVIDPT